MKLRSSENAPPRLKPGSAALKLGERTLELEALPSQGTVLLEIREVTIWARRSRQSAARIAEVSHELRTPLTHILGFADMMQSQIFGPLEPKYLEYTGLIRQAGENLLSVDERLASTTQSFAVTSEKAAQTFASSARLIDGNASRLTELSSQTLKEIAATRSRDAIINLRRRRLLAQRPYPPRGFRQERRSWSAWPFPLLPR